MERTLYRAPGIIEISKGWNFNYKISQYHEHLTLIISLFYITFYISLPDTKYYDCDKWDRAWGISYHDRSLWFNFGEKTKSFYMPWMWEHVRHEVMFNDGLRKPPGEPWDNSDGRIVEIYPYTYTLKSGEKQQTKATCYIEEREWRWRWFKFLPWPRIVRRSISVDFSDEIGERTGSWKGGVIGCGYDMLPGETMEQTLKRMESERKFD